MAEPGREPWSWRKASGGLIWLGDDRWVDTPTGRTVDRFFHAYDVNGLAACEPVCSLLVSCEEPNEESRRCTQCIEVVDANPGGRV